MLSVYRIRTGISSCQRPGRAKLNYQESGEGNQKPFLPSKESSYDILRENCASALYTACYQGVRHEGWRDLPLVGKSGHCHSYLPRRAQTAGFGGAVQSQGWLNVLLSLQRLEIFV